MLIVSTGSIRVLAITNNTAADSSNTKYSLNYSSFFGGISDDSINDIAVDNEGSIYITGRTASPDFPVIDPYNSTTPTLTFQSAFVAKFDQNGHLLFSRYLGGSGLDLGYGITVDNNHNFYVIGDTRSSDFPILNAYQSTNTNSSLFLTKFNPDGQMNYSTFLGGTGYDSGKEVAVDQSGNIYVCGHSNSDNFNIKSAFQTTRSGDYDSIVAKFDKDGTLVFSTYYGGDKDDSCQGLTIDPNGNIYISGDSLSSNLPLAGNSYQTSKAGNSVDSFYAEFDPQGNLTYATYLGETYQESNYGIEVDLTGNVYLAGATQSDNFTVTSDAYNKTFSGIWDIYLTKFSSNNSLSYSTYVGGNGNDIPYGFTLDNSGNIYLAGYTGSTNFPVVNAYNDTNSGSNDVFITKFSSDFTLEYSTYFGSSGWEVGNAITIDHSGNIILGGVTNSDEFPTAYAFDATRGGSYEGFIVKFNNLNSAIDGSNEDLLAEFQTLLSNQIFVVVFGIAIISVLINLISLFRRRR